LSDREDEDPEELLMIEPPEILTKPRQPRIAFALARLPAIATRHCSTLPL
jgi:hypothetical protein